MPEWGGHSGALGMYGGHGRLRTESRKMSITLAGRLLGEAEWRAQQAEVTAWRTIWINEGKVKAPNCDAPKAHSQPLARLSLTALEWGFKKKKSEAVMFPFSNHKTLIQTFMVTGFLGLKSFLSYSTKVIHFYPVVLTFFILVNLAAKVVRRNEDIIKLI